MIKNIREILILLLILLVAYQFIFPAKEIIEKPVIETITLTDTTYVTVNKTKTVYVPKYIIETQTVEIPSSVDTLQIIKDYYTEYVYSDTLTVDSLGFGYLKDTIFMNRISSRVVSWDYKIPIITHTTETTITLPPKREFQFYIGATIAGDKTAINYFGPSIGFKTRSNKIFTLGMGLVGSDNVGLTISAYYKLF